MTTEPLPTKDQATTTAQHSRRAPRAAKIIFGTLAGLIALWSVAQLAMRHDPTTPLYSESDLPQLPPPDDNGWELLQKEWHSLGEPKRPEKEITELCDAKAVIDDRWSRAEGRAEKLSTVAHDASKWLELLDKAFAKPRFADACPSALDQKCPRALHLLALHQMQEAAALHDAMTGRWEDAWTRTAKMVRADIDFLPSGRSAITQSVSQANIHRSLKLIATLFDGSTSWTKSGKGPDPSKQAAFAKEISDRLSLIREEDMAPQRAVVAEYIFARHAFDLSLEPVRAKYGPITTIVYDPGQTTELLDVQFKKLAAFASDTTTAPPTPYRRSSTWFLRNPLGQIFLEMVQPTLVDRIPMLEKDRQKIIQDRNELQARLLQFAVAQ